MKVREVVHPHRRLESVGRPMPRKGRRRERSTLKKVLWRRRVRRSRFRENGARERSGGGSRWWLAAEAVVSGRSVAVASRRVVGKSERSASTGEWPCVWDPRCSGQRVWLGLRI